MVLEFPVLADYAVLVLNDHTIFATHGHLYNENNLPPLMTGDVLLHGHSHLTVAEKLPLNDIGDFFFHLNPGSVSIPKGGSNNSYAILDDDLFTIYDFDGNTSRIMKLS
jgi:putative phosphoesterase